MTGALTSTPALAVAMEVTGDSLTSIGYGIAYLFGVVGVVLFIQIIPKLIKVDMKSELREISGNGENNTISNRETKPLRQLEEYGILPFAFAVVIGMLIAGITIPLPGGAVFSLGSSGAPLLVGLVMGHFGKMGNISIMPSKATLNTMREFGLALFLLGAGLNAGNGFIEVLKEHGLGLFIIGAFITLLPMVTGYFFARNVFKLGVLNTLGSICGGMTSTPALGSLIQVAKSDLVAASYAATYPVALIFIVLSTQLICILFK
jgi:putative transport protein